MSPFAPAYTKRKTVLKRFRNYCGLINLARGGFPWEKTTKGEVASVYTNCDTAYSGFLLRSGKERNRIPPGAKRYFRFRSGYQGHRIRVDPHMGCGSSSTLHVCLYLIHSSRLADCCKQCWRSLENYNSGCRPAASEIRSSPMVRVFAIASASGIWVISVPRSTTSRPNCPSCTRSMAADP